MGRGGNTTQSAPAGLLARRGRLRVPKPPLDPDSGLGLPAEMLTVRSTNLARIGYDRWTKRLFVEFADNAVYVWNDVPEQAYIGLREASSHGRYLSNYIANGTYQSEKLRERGALGAFAEA